MPLRGTQTKPEASIKDSLDNLREAQKEVQEAGHKLEGAQEALEAVRLVTKDNPSTAELLEVIAALNARVAALESQQKSAWQHYFVANEAVKETMKQLFCGGVAGAVARTVVSPIDRVKILMQTEFLLHKGETKYTGIMQTWRKIFNEEGFLRLWRGNATNVFRVIPYSATQFASYDFYKRWILGDKKQLSTTERLMAGALAGMTATSLTHPLDVIRLRLNVEPQLKNALDATRSIMQEAGFRGLFKGYTPTLVSLSPFIAINFASFDLLKRAYFADTPRDQRSSLAILALGGAAGLFAQTCCYPLDTVRRRMQIRGTHYKHTIDAFVTIMKKEGFQGFYRGMVPNAVKVVPNNSIRFLVFEWLKQKFNLKGGGGD